MQVLKFPQRGSQHSGVLGRDAVQLHRLTPRKTVSSLRRSDTSNNGTSRCGETNRTGLTNVFVQPSCVYSEHV
jgi:hypothetical protein